MTSQSRPARQGKIASSHRLTELGTRFPAATPETRQEHATCRATLFLMDDPKLSWVTRELCRILTQKGYSSRLCQLRKTSNGGQQQPKRAGDCEYLLVPTTSTTAVMEYNFDHVVLLVPASLEAVLAAYQHIKRLAQQRTPDIGIVLVGPQEQNSAWHYFRKLAVSALRYLDTPLLNLGFLPEQVTPEHRSTYRHSNNFLARISERLLRSEFYTSYPAQKFNQGRE